LAEDILSTTKPGTLLLVGGDEIVLPLLYLQAVEGRQLGVKLVLTPLLPGEWYIKQLRRRYPDLVIPFDRHDPRSGTMKSLIDANQGHPIAVVGKPLDESTEGSYWFYRYGVVDLVEPMAKDLTLPQMINDNEEMLGRYRPPSPDEIKKKSFEETILSHYTATLLAVGRESEKARFYLEAKKWYERAVSMDPNLSEAREALVRLEKVKTQAKGCEFMIAPSLRSDLAPTGPLRVGINYGNPVLATRVAASGELCGVAVDLARELGTRTGLPINLVGYDSAGKMVEALQAGSWDIAFLAIDPGRAEQIRFTAP